MSVVDLDSTPSFIRNHLLKIMFIQTIDILSTLLKIVARGNFGVRDHGYFIGAHRALVYL